MAEDYFSETSYLQWLSRAYQGWVVRGLAPPLYKDRTIVNLADLNPQCYREVENFVKKKLERSLKTASKQIQATKNSHGTKESKGLVFLVNDGNYGVVPTMIQNITARCLPKYSGINTIIYFSANLPMRSPTTDMDVLPWCAWSRESTRAPVDADFLERIWKAWRAHFESVSGERIHVMQGSSEALSSMSYRKKPI